MAQFTTRQLQGESDSLNKTGLLEIGALLQDRYQILGPLGMGGFSSVYKARDMRFPSVTKLCAIKEMLIHTNDPQIRQETIKSFEREASMLAVLKHPAIPDISDYFTDGDRSYLVLELIPGRNLQQWLDDTHELVDEQRALDWALQICEALAYLHGQKPQPVVFRDLKPANIMLDTNNKLRLIDFGIAKLFEADQDRGTMIGTEGYTPPEQYRGEATPAADIYALGATLHHLMTRIDPRLETPFTFDERPIRRANPQISPAFESIIMKTLSYDPKDRYPDAMALRESLLVLQEVETDEAEMEPVGMPLSAETDVPQVKIGTSQIKPRWTFTCEDEIRSKVAVAKGIVFVGAYDNNVYAVTADKGDFLWKYPTHQSVASAPAVYEDAVYIASADNHVYALGLRNGRETWRFATEGSIYSSPTVRYDHVFIGADDGYFYALNASGGKLAWRSLVYDPVRSTPFVSDDRVFFGTEGGQIYSLELSTGKTRWQSQAKQAVTSSPTVADDILVVGSLDATVYALDASSGWPIWRFRTQRPVISSPTVHDGIVYVGSADGHLYAIDMDSGRKVWSYQTGGQIASSPVVWDRAVYFGSTDGNIYGLSLKRGDLQWRYDTSSLVIASPNIVDGVMYVGTTQNKLYALPI